jgi:diguanylate cyclase (GGDEF)-like protein
VKADPTKWVIALGFSALLALMSATTYISLSQMDENIARMAELVDITNAKTSATHAMRDSVRMRGEVLTKMHLLEDVFDREEMRLQLFEHGLMFRNARDSLTAYPLNARELQLISKVRPYTLNAKTLNENTAELLLEDDVPTARIQNELRLANAARRKMLDILDELVNYQNQYSKYVLTESVRYHENTSSIIILLSVATFFFGILISLLVIRQAAKKNYEIQHQANHDALTELVNRKEFERRLESSIASAKETGKEHVLCYMDLDQFKIVNDTCGHNAGDQLLIELSQLLRGTVRENDTLGRLGGDEFGLLLESCSLENALEISEGIISLIKNYEFKWQNRTFHIGVSIGLSHITKKSKDIATILSEADVACYAAKDMGRSRVHVHMLHDEQVKKIHKELSWVADIETSLKDKRFKLYVQPIAPLDSNNNQCMYEVLLRLKDDNGNIVSPGEYIPAAERFNLMRAVDVWVVSEVIKKIESMQTSGISTPRMFVNLSANSIVDKTFCEYVLKLLQDHNIADYSICFEITETAAIKNIQQASQFMQQLKEAHCLFALDDFGTGMSSFTYLKNMPVDYLKIDGSFVMNMDKNTIDQAMVAAIHQIGRVMDIKTIAEHAETEAIMDHLEKIGVTFAQGYYIGKPVPIAELATKLSDKESLAS